MIVRLNSSFELSDFKRIFYMEWGHRVLGRVLGLAFVGPLLYFSMRRQLSRQMSVRLLGLGLLIGAQGALGWYMVKSGLDDALMETPGAVPRVSQYRLASHLGLAFLLYAGMFATGMNAVKEWKWAVKGKNWMGVVQEGEYARALNALPVKRFKAIAWALTGLVFLTALSGMGFNFADVSHDMTYLLYRCICRWSGCRTAL
jgi:heme a synthase